MKKLNLIGLSIASFAHLFSAVLAVLIINNPELSRVSSNAYFLINILIIIGYIILAKSHKVFDKARNIVIAAVIWGGLASMLYMSFAFTDDYEVVVPVVFAINIISTTLDALAMLFLIKGILNISEVSGISSVSKGIRKAGFTSIGFSIFITGYNLLNYFSEIGINTEDLNYIMIASKILMYLLCVFFAITMHNKPILYGNDNQKNTGVHPSYHPLTNQKNSKNTHGEVGYSTRDEVYKQFEGKL